MIPQLPLGIGLRVDADFDSFYAGANRQVVAEIIACVRNSGERYLYLWGPKGSGKSHLLQAGCALAADLGNTVAYIPFENICRYSPEILEGLERQQLVCLDDLHAFAGKPEWERAMFRLFNRMHHAGSRLLVSAEPNHPNLGIALPDLVSRLGSGLNCRLKPLDDEHRLALILDHAQRRGLSLSDECAYYILHRAPRDTRSLITLIGQLDQASLAAQRRLTVPFIKTIVDAGRES